MKTIDINAREWFDKTYGNIYFSAIVTVDYGMETEKSFPVHFQCMVTEIFYRYVAFEELKKQGIIKADDNVQFWQWCRDNKVIARYNIHRGCKKRDVVNFTK